MGRGAEPIFVTCTLFGENGLGPAVEVNLDQICYLHRSVDHRCTVVALSNGATLTVLEDPDYVLSGGFS